MLQNQENQKLMHNQIFQERKGRLTIEYARMSGTISGYQHPSNEKFDVNGVPEISKEHHVIEDRRDLNLLTREQRRLEADQHEHPYEYENSPWRKQQTAVTGQGNSNYTNRY